MKTFTVLTSALLALGTTTVVVAKEPPTTLQIGVTHQVPVCKVKSQNGDKLAM